MFRIKSLFSFHRAFESGTFDQLSVSAVVRDEPWYLKSQAGTISGTVHQIETKKEVNRNG
jgi:hypothetical protein